MIKNRYKRAITVVLSILLSFLMTTQTFAYPPGVIGNELYGNYVMQQNSNWCWAATAENINRWGGNPNRTQRDAVRYIKGNFFDPYPNSTASLEETRRAAQYISENTKTFSAASHTITYYSMCDEIYHNHPVIAGCVKHANGSYFGHIVLVIGWYSGNGDNQLFIYDPAEGYYQECIYEEFCNGTTEINLRYLETIRMG